MSERKEIVNTAASSYNGTIKPWRLGRLLKAAYKIMDLLITADVGVSYDECLTVLDIVRDSILAVKDKTICE